MENLAIEKLLRSELLEVRGGTVSKNCHCKSGAAAGTNGDCFCDSGAAQIVPSGCTCNNGGAAQTIIITPDPGPGKDPV